MNDSTDDAGTLERARTALTRAFHPSRLGRVPEPALAAMLADTDTLLAWAARLAGGDSPGMALTPREVAQLERELDKTGLGEPDPELDEKVDRFLAVPDESRQRRPEGRHAK